MIYIASPYSHPDKHTMRQRFKIVEAFTAALLGDGLPVYSPIVHCHEIAFKYDLPKTFEYWQELNLNFVFASNELYVLQLADWQKSVGVSGEICAAKARNIPITYWEWVDKGVLNGSLDSFKRVSSWPA